MTFPFYGPEHEERFKAARALVQRGGAAAPVCGARTRDGGRCRHPPLKGQARCLRHAGPKAAMEQRDRQWRDVQRGQMSWEDFARAEARRAANRLRWRWKKNPWMPGSTIDLGEHEERFKAEIGHPEERGQTIAPAILDWLRWKFRRLQMDRRRDSEWAAVLRYEYPDRVRAAGHGPAIEPLPPEPEAAVWSAPPPSAVSRRGRLDRVRARGTARSKRLRAVAPRHETPEAERQVLARLARENRVVVAPLIQKCDGEGEELAFLRLLRACVENPNDQRARTKWIAAARALSER